MAHPEHILVAKPPRAGIRDNSWLLRVGFVEPEGKKDYRQSLVRGFVGSW